MFWLYETCWIYSNDGHYLLLDVNSSETALHKRNTLICENQLIFSMIWRLSKKLDQFRFIDRKLLAESKMHTGFLLWINNEMFQTGTFMWIIAFHRHDIDRFIEESSIINWGIMWNCLLILMRHTNGQFLTGKNIAALNTITKLLWLNEKCCFFLAQYNSNEGCSEKRKVPGGRGA